MTTTTPTMPKAKVPVKAVPPSLRRTLVVAASPAEQLKALANQRADILEAITDAEAAPRPLAEAGPDLRKLVQEAASARQQLCCRYCAERGGLDRQPARP